MIYNYGQCKNGKFFRWMGKAQGPEKTDGKIDIYRTYFGYPDGTEDIKGYTGPHYTEFFPIDIDNKNLNEAFEVFKIYIQKYPNSRWYFSGSKGFHIEIPLIFFEGFTEGASLYKQFRAYAKKELKAADMAIYDISRLWRITNTVNSKTGLYKIQISMEDINKGLEYILNKAKEKQPTFDIKYNIEKKISINTSKNYDKIHEGAIENGDRHATMMSLIGYLVNKKVDDAVIIQLVSNIPFEDGEEMTQQKIIVAINNLKLRQFQNFKFSSKGKILNIIRNYITAINTGFNITYDKFLGSLKVDGKPIRDVDYVIIKSYLEDNYQLSSRENTTDGVLLAGYEKDIDTLKDYVINLAWDGKPRAESFFIDALGANDTYYTRKVTRVNLLGAIYRALVAGTKHDTMLVLQGGQGIGKSTIISKLAKGWSNTAPLSLNDKDAFQTLDGSWIVEFAELATYKKYDDLARLKEYLTKSEDKYRRSFGKTTTTNPRRCIFMGTTNEKKYLRDQGSEERRFHPLEVKKPNWDLFDDKYIDQVWAEVYTWYLTGEKNWISNDSKFDAEYAAIIKATKVEDEAAEVLESAIIDKNIITTGEALAVLGYSMKDINNRFITSTVARYLENIGYIREYRKIEGKTTRVWVKNKVN